MATLGWESQGLEDLEKDPDVDGAVALFKPLIRQGRYEGAWKLLSIWLRPLAATRTQIRRTGPEDVLGNPSGEAVDHISHIRRFIYTWLRAGGLGGTVLQGVRVLVYSNLVNNGVWVHDKGIEDWSRRAFKRMAMVNLLTTLGVLHVTISGNVCPGPRFPALIPYPGEVKALIERYEVA